MAEVGTSLAAGVGESAWGEKSEIVGSVVEIGADPLRERILRRGKGKYVEAACMKGIMDQKRSEATRSRLVLDRIGRSPSSDFIELLDSVNAPAERELAMAISALVGEAVRSDSGE